MPETLTVAAFLTNEIVRPAVRPLTFEQCGQHVRLYLTPELGKWRLTKLDAAEGQGFVNRLLKRGLSARTAHLSLVTLKRALKQAEREGLIQRNVAKLVDAPRVKPHKVVPLNPEQSKHLLDYRWPRFCGGPREQPYPNLFTANQGLHGEVFEDALLDLLEPIMILFEDALSFLDVELVLAYDFRHDSDLREKRGLVTTPVFDGMSQSLLPGAFFMRAMRCRSSWRSSHTIISSRSLRTSV